MRRRTARWLARLRRPRSLALLLPALLLGAVGVRGVTRIHMRIKSGRLDVSGLTCTNCHGAWWSTEFPAGTPHPDPWAMTLGADGVSLHVACGPTHELAVLDLERRAVRRVIKLAGEPRGLALSPDGASLAVSLGDRDALALLDVHTLTSRRELAAGLSPEGLAFAPDGATLFVANAGSGDVSVIDVASGRERHRLPAGREPFAVALAPGGDTLAVISRMVSPGPADAAPAAEVTLIDARAGRLLRRIPLPSAHLSEGAVFTKDGRWLLVPAVHVRNLLPILQVHRGWVMSSVLAVIEVASGSSALLPLNGPNTSFPDPSGIALSADGRRAYLASGGSNRVCSLDVPALLEAAAEVAEGDPERLWWRERYLEACFDTGPNPRGVVALGGAGSARLAVSERLGDSVALLEAGAAGAPLARIPIGRTIPDDAVRRGARVFHDAGYAFQGAFSCRSCHPGGHTDGLVYDFDIDGVGRNQVLNRSLRGVAGTEPFKWIGLNPTLQRQCGPRFAMVLTRADPFPEDRLEDLVAFIQSLPAPRPHPGAGRVGGHATGALARGEAIFTRDHRKDGTPIPPTGRCVGCHVPPHFTSRLKEDVGTRGPYDTTGSFDVPHLTGIASKAPYLHDGRARTLEEIWTRPGVGDSHGVVTDLSKSDLNDLVQYLRGL